MKGGKNLILLLALLALLLGAQAPAHACVILEVYEDPYAAPIRDGEIIDIKHQPNRATATGKVDHDWFINLATGNVGPNMVVAGKDHKSGHANGRAGLCLSVQSCNFRMKVLRAPILFCLGGEFEVRRHSISGCTVIIRL